jgi:MFS family permease
MRRHVISVQHYLTQLGWHPRQGGRAGILMVLGLAQWLAWGSTYYLMTVIGRPIADDTGWHLATAVDGLSLGLVLAGLVSPRVGRTVERRGARPVLAAGSVLLATGLVVLALARSPAIYFGAWAVLGLGMGASLYDAAFAALGWLYGAEARRMIANLTLIGGLAMTVTWPLSAFLAETLGWRGTCLAYAALHLGLGLPLLLLLPRQPVIAPEAARADPAPARPPRRGGILIWLVGANLTLQIGIGSVLAVHLLALLRGSHLTLGFAVALGSMMGACQVAGRAIETLVARRVHPVWEGVVASALVLLGFVLLLTGSPPVVTVALIVYGLGNGVRTIVKGTLPLVLFGAEGYAALIGRLGLPTLVAQAAGPALGALMLARYGAMSTLQLLAGLALVNLALSYALRLGLPMPRRARLEAPSLADR